MASANSGINPLTIESPGAFGSTSSQNSHYQTEVTILGDGSFKRDTYRTDAKGNNRVLIEKSTVSPEGVVSDTSITSDATVAEKRELKKPASPLRKIVKTQTSSAAEAAFENQNTPEDELTAVGKANAQVLGGGSGNTDTQNAGEEKEPETSFFEQGFTFPEINIRGRRRLNYENLFYPEDIVSSKQDRVKFTMFFQSGRSIDFSFTDNSPFTLGERTITNINGSVTLPITVAQDSNTVSFSGRDLNPIQGGLAAVSLDPQGAFGELIKLLGMSPAEMTEKFNSTFSKNALAALRLYLAQTASGAEGLIPRTTGAILNPNVELLLNKPDLRSFNFNFTMSARSRKEAVQIRKIIRFFKQGMSVKKSPTSLFIVSPNMFKIQYLTGNDEGGFRDHPSVGKIKDCALTALNTTYGDGSTYMTFDDDERTMTQYTIQMQFTELNPITEDDYLDDVAREDEIGF